MQIMDSPARYGAVSRLLHWTLAGLIGWQILGMILKEMLGRRSALAVFMVENHDSVGFLIFGLVWLRVLWLALNRRNRPGAGAGRIGGAARIGHLALYALMLFVPGVAVLRAFGGTHPVAVFGLQLRPGQPAGQANEILTGMAAWHAEAGWLLAVLIAGHLVMVAIHALRKDGVLRRMAG